MFEEITTDSWEKWYLDSLLVGRKKDIKGFKTQLSCIILEFYKNYSFLKANKAQQHKKKIGCDQN